MTELLLLASAWVLWCSLHSLLASPLVQAWLERCFPVLAGRYRLVYNLFATLSILPLLCWQGSRPASPLLLVWAGPWEVLRAAAWVAAVALFWGGARVYPLREFCGLRPPDRFRPEGPPPLVTQGVLGVVRHPWYLAGLLVLWGRDLDREGLLSAGLLSAYLVLGAHLEERRLLRIYGQTYRRYQHQVAGLVPGKPLLRRLVRRFGCGRRH